MENKKWRCKVCGQAFEGNEPPIPCPICGAGADAFEEIGAPAPQRWRCVICNQEFDGKTPPEICPVCGAGTSAFEPVGQAEQSQRQDTDEHFVIVGGGVAGLEACKLLRQINQTASITLLCGEGVLPYNRPALSDVVADGLSLAAITLEEQSWFEENNVKLLYQMATELHPAEKILTLADASSISYDKLLLALGAKAFCPVSTQSSMPVLVLRSFADAEKVTQLAESATRAVVVGGGILGLEAALALYEHNVEVTVVEREAEIMSLQADTHASHMLAQALQKKGMEIYTAATIASVESDAVVLADGTRLPCDMVLVSAGIRSETELAKQAGLTVNRGIVVDEHMTTSDPSIFAAGDCAEVGGKTAGNWPEASAQGRAAAAAMAGFAQPYTPQPPALIFEGAGIMLFSGGFLRGEDLKRVTLHDPLGDYKLLTFRHNKLCGVLLVGNTNAAGSAISALSAGKELSGALQLLC